MIWSPFFKTLLYACFATLEKKKTFFDTLFKITKNVSFQCIANCNHCNVLAKILSNAQPYFAKLSNSQWYSAILILHKSNIWNMILTQSSMHFRFDLVDLSKLQSNESNWIWKCFYDTNWTSIYEIKHNLPIENPIKLTFQIHNDGRRPQVQKEVEQSGVGALDWNSIVVVFLKNTTSSPPSSLFLVQ